MPTIDVSQTNVKKEGTALTIEPMKDPKSGLGVSIDTISIKKNSSVITIEAVKEQKDG